MTANTVLLCTVGGSHQPILTAIESTSPDFVCFFCTGRDPATGQAGSIRQVTGKGSVIKAQPGDSGATLPNIPRQAGLDDGAFEAREVPADDLDRCVAVIHASRFTRCSWFVQGGKTEMLRLLLNHEAVTRRPA